MASDGEQAVNERFQRLQRYLGWSDLDRDWIQRARELVQPAFPQLVADFYEAVLREPAAVRVITGGEEQVERLKQKMYQWLEELFSGNYDGLYVVRRWRVGRRHVEIGLDQSYANMAMGRLRLGIIARLGASWPAGAPGLTETVLAINRLIDLDLALIEDAYQLAYARRRESIERLAAIGQVAGGIAHELRNPLHVISTSVYYLVRAGSLPPDKLTEHLERIARQVGRASEVVNALNDLARLPVPELRLVQVSACVDEVLRDLVLPAEIQLVRDIPDNLSRVLADERQLRIALSNLVRNACDAMAQGGQLTLRGRSVGDRVAIEIADTGVGIAPEVLPRILEPLFSTKACGIGLGLAVTRAILDKHNAHLAVESEVGRGSMFRISLPAATPEQVEAVW